MEGQDNILRFSSRSFYVELEARLDVILPLASVSNIKYNLNQAIFETTVKA
jgi:hypothetical protein